MGSGAVLAGRSMSVLDAAGPLPGLFESSWPMADGGPRRQKAPRSPGLDLGEGERLAALVSANGRANVGFVQREPGELYLLAAASAQAGPRVERLDPRSLAVLAGCDLPGGPSPWGGALLVHASGDLYVAQGEAVVRLDRDLKPAAERRCAGQGPLASLIVLPDGNLVAKEATLERPARVYLLEPERLEVLQTLELPEASLGGLAADFGEKGVFLYLPGREVLFRLSCEEGRLALDDDWQPMYRDEDEGQGLAWELCLADGNAWLHDNGDPPAVRALLGAGDGADEAFGPQGVMRFALEDDYDRDALAPIPCNHAWVTGPPLYVPIDRVLVTYDTANARVAALVWKGDGLYDRLWDVAVCNHGAPLVFPDTGELVVEDRPLAGGESASLVVLGLADGREKARVDLGARAPGRSSLAPGWDRDLYTCGNGSIARVFVEG
jgi:hypothetical protein